MSNVSNSLQRKGQNNKSPSQKSIKILAQNQVYVGNQQENDENARKNSNFSYLDGNTGKGGDFQTQNEQLKKKNRQLIRQLQQFSKKLDQQLKKRSNSVKKKDSISRQQKQSIQIQNLYKKMQIYKKQIFLLKGKIDAMNDGEFKSNDYENKLKLLTKQNQDLKSQIKTLQRIIKQQQKGLSELGADGFIKISGENEKNKDEIRKLRMQLDQLGRKARSSYNLSASLQKQSSKKIVKHSTASHKKRNEFRTKVNTSFRMRTQPNIKQQQQKWQSQKSHVQKVELKLRGLAIEKTRQKQIIENLKVQILQKDKQITYLKDKVQNLRKLYKHKPKKWQQKQQRVEQIQQEYKPQMDRGQSAISSYPRYPRLQQHGIKSASHFKWNHHQFSSKIKAIFISLHPQGFISQLHIRYEKGQPHHQMIKQSKAIVCSENDEFVQYIKGGFKNQYLQYLEIKTNFNRTEIFGNLDEDDSQNFTFQITQQEYPCSLFGENDQVGVRRIGCLIEKINR